MRLLALLVPVAGCVLPDDDFDRDGFTVADGDCDDFDPERNPAATDVAGDGLDQDCSGAETVMRVEGDAFSCVLDAAGLVVCTGSNDFGELEVPEPAEGAEFVMIAAGLHHTCALDDHGAVLCWGDDTFGQTSPPPFARFVSIDAGGNWSSGELDPGGLTCWGLCWESGGP